MIQIRYLYISPGHNYFGHHGKEASQHPTVEVDSVECVAGKGLVGDRFFDFKPDYKGQITFFSWEVFEGLRQELQLSDVSPAGTRRNVILQGVDLKQWIGKTFEIQGVQFEGTEECRPCYWMNSSFRHVQAEEWLKGRGGLRAKILTDGILKKG